MSLVVIRFRPQTMFQNLFGLFGFSIMMFNSWAFKDTVIAIVGFGTPPTNCLDKTLDGAECESSSLSERVSHKSPYHPHV